MADTDRLSAALEERLKAWRSVTEAPAIPEAPKDWLVTELDAWFLTTAKTAMPRLLAALEVVLKLAGEAEEVRDYSGYETHGRLVGWRLNPEAVRATVLANLTGEEADDGH